MVASIEKKKYTYKEKYTINKKRKIQISIQEESCRQHQTLVYATFLREKNRIEFKQKIYVSHTVLILILNGKKLVISGYLEGIVFLCGCASR